MPSVLLVDDESDDRMPVSHFLTVVGHPVRTAASMDEAIAHAHAHAHRFAAAVLDLRLPGDDGDKLCRRLRLHPATADLSILMCPPT